MIERRIKRSAMVVAAGLAVQTITALHWTPGTFVVSAVIGVPLVLVGGGLFLRAVWKNLRDKGAA